jgi:hypothetical protein
MRRHASGARCGSRGFCLASRLPGASELRPSATTSRARGARSRQGKPVPRRARTGGEKGRSGAPGGETHRSQGACRASPSAELFDAPSRRSAPLVVWEQGKRTDAARAVNNRAGGALALLRPHPEEPPKAASRRMGRPHASRRVLRTLLSMRPRESWLFENRIRAHATLGLRLLVRNWKISPAGRALLNR